MTVTTIHFGKYAGRTYQWVLQTDPQYLQWAHENVQGFFLSLEQQCEVRTAVEVANEKLYARQEAMIGVHGRDAWWEDYDDPDSPYHLDDWESWA